MNFSHQRGCVWMICFWLRASLWRTAHLAVSNVRRSWAVTSGRHVGRRLIPADGHTLLKLVPERASTWKAACALFPTDGSAPVAGGSSKRWRRKEKNKKGPAVCGFSQFSACFYDFCFLFTPNHSLGTETWQTLFLFVSWHWFDASAFEPAGSGFRCCYAAIKMKKSPLWFSL